MYRTHNNGEMRLQDVNSEVTLCGWVAKRRNFGALVFIDLRDRYGITQLVFNEDIATQISDVRNEYVLQVKGTVVERKDKNPKLATGEIEVVVREVKIVNTAITTPMIIADETDALEDTRLKYRYLDLRRPVMQKNFILRHNILKSIRSYLDGNDFIEVEIDGPLSIMGPSKFGISGGATAFWVRTQGKKGLCKIKVKSMYFEEEISIEVK